MFALKPISRDSICCDILEIAPDNQPALISLILSLTDQIHQDGAAFANALAAAARLETGYDRFYYAGMAGERRAKALYYGKSHAPRHYAYEWIAEALRLFE